MCYVIVVQPNGNFSYHMKPHQLNSTEQNHEQSNLGMLYLVCAYLPSGKDRNEKLKNQGSGKVQF